MSSPTIFISYRRDDTRWAAAMIYQALEWAFGRNSVFFDRSTLVPGMEWPEKICTAVEQSRVVLAVIGKSWLAAADSAGQARLFQDGDWVRHELGTALRRADGPLVIPVFIDDAKSPRADQLPPDLAALPSRQGRSVREVPDFDADIAAVVGQIARRLGVQPQPFASVEREKMVTDYYATKDGGNRHRMIAKVRAAWIHGVLDKALSKADAFTLGLDFAPTAVVQPRGSSAVPLLDLRNIAEVFEEFDRRLLILGTPGAGKTILLLQLAHRLLNDADREIDAPIPVVLNLS
jgi:TIR domain